jgi:hypothetical protein
MASAPSAVGKFEIGRVIGETFSGIKRNWLVMIVISGAVAAMSAILGVIVMRSMVDVTVMQTNPLAMFSSLGYWGTVVGSLFLNAFATSALLTVALDKQGADLGRAIAGGLRFFLPMLGLTIVWTLGMMVGLMLLVVPGVILITMWSVSAPALIAENAGVFGAFGRSQALTKGIRWNVFGALIVFAIIFYVIIFAIQGLGGGSMALYTANIATAFIIAVASSILSTLFIPSFLAALYVETIGAKEGGHQSELAEIFT